MTTPKRPKAHSVTHLVDSHRSKKGSRPDDKSVQDETGESVDALDDKLASAEFDQILLDGFIERIERTVSNAIDSRKEVLAYEILERLGKISGSTPAPADAEEKGGWKQIESLSALRALVGGRFQNLKEKWIQAGLPLREHRGDKIGDYTVNDAGWIDLSNWILKQGFETRLVSGEPHTIFEIRKR